MAFGKKSGQILVLVLLVVVIALAVGLSAASRNLTNLRSSTQTEQSERAFTSAEGGIEGVLPQLNTIGSGLGGVASTEITGTGCTSAGDGETANCAISSSDSTVIGSVKVVAVKAYEKFVEPGSVAQVVLDGYPSGNSLDIEWINNANNCDVILPGDNCQSTVEFIFVCQGAIGQSLNGACKGDNLVNGYGQHREVYKNGSPPGQSGSIPNCSIGTAPYKCKMSFTMPTGNYIKYLRIKPFWNGTTVKITPSDQLTFPVQSYEITSSATTETGVSRKVEVVRDRLPQLPAVFDYVLYSGQNIEK